MTSVLPLLAADVPKASFNWPLDAKSLACGPLIAVTDCLGAACRLGGVKGRTESMARGSKPSILSRRCNAACRCELPRSRENRWETVLIMLTSRTPAIGTMRGTARRTRPARLLTGQTAFAMPAKIPGFFLIRWLV